MVCALHAACVSVCVTARAVCLHCRTSVVGTTGCGGGAECATRPRRRAACCCRRALAVASSSGPCCRSPPVPWAMTGRRLVYAVCRVALRRAAKTGGFSRGTHVAAATMVVRCVEFDRYCHRVHGMNGGGAAAAPIFEERRACARTCAAFITESGQTVVCGLEQGGLLLSDMRAAGALRRPMCCVVCRYWL